MITCILQGGLGNQLFQIVTTISYAMTHERKFSFLYSSTLDIGLQRPTYWNSIFFFLKKYLYYKEPIDHMNAQVIQEAGFHYTELPAPTESSVVLNGYFQSEKYFQKTWAHIYQLLRVDQQKDVVQSRRLYHYKNMISLHFRLGDLYHTKPAYYPSLPLAYYQRSIDHLIHKLDSTSLQFLVFYEKEHEDQACAIVTDLQTLFPDCRFIRVTDHIPDYEQMLMMSLCKHHIIANSTFSWWGAYLNSESDKIVCCPSSWFGPALSHLSIQDVCPDSWNKISV